MKKRFALLPFAAALSLAAGNVLAAVPADVTTSLTDAKADTITIATASLIIIIGLAAFKMMRRAV